MSNHITDIAVQTFQASGKLMLFGEYLVLDGANCLAIPLKFGQQLTVENSEETYFTWKSHATDACWFEVEFDANCQVISTTSETIATTLMNLLLQIKAERPQLFKQPLSFQAHADFDLKWGLGSSSTLISLLAQWASVNPYTLLENSFGGSGYDVACATVDHPICYTKKDRVFSYVRLSPAITNKILFVYSGNKQNSKAEIKRYSNLENSLENVDKMNEIIENAFLATSIDAFEKQVLASEQLLANALQLETIQNNHFADYPYAIKSLGAWGGDFFMATFRDEQEARTYFQNRGFNQQFTYSEIIK